MNLLNRISIKQRIIIIVSAMMLLLLIVLSITLASSARRQNLFLADRQLTTALDRLEQTVIVAEQQSGPGFNQTDYMMLKPLFNQSIAFQTDFPILIDNTGSILIHITREGQRFPREMMRQMYSAPGQAGVIPFSDQRGRSGTNSLLYFKRSQAHNAFVAIEFNPSESLVSQRNTILMVWILGAVALLIVYILILYALNPTIEVIGFINRSLSKLVKGEIPPTISYQTSDESAQIAAALNQHIEGLNKTASFATAIGKNDLSADFKPLSNSDRLGNSLLEMRQSLKSAIEEDERRKKEDEQRSWFNSGLASFSDILRQNNNNLQKLSDVVIQNMVNYLDANQGGLFMLNDDDPKDQFLELIAAFAYNRKKIVKKTIHPGEGLVGNCLLEKETLYLSEIPDDYIQISSGLGDATPRSLLIVPLILEDKIFGVVEIASFKEFKPFEIEFVEKIGESIASSLSSVKTSIRTNQLLEQSQQQREEMVAQEEEMRQNMEEMLATQEEMGRKNAEMEAMTSSLDEMLIFCELTTSGYFLRTNENFLNLTLSKKSEMESKSVEEFVHPNDMSAFQAAWKKMHEGTSYRGTMQFVDSNGGIHFLLCSMIIASDSHGSLQKVFFLGQDVTESKQIELKAIKQSEEIEQTLLELQVEHDISQEREAQLKFLLQALDKVCLVVEMDPDGTIRFINQKYSDIFGRSCEELEGTPCKDIHPLAKSSPKEYEELWQRILDGSTEHIEVKVLAEGKEIWLSEIFTPILDDNHEIATVICISIDITKGKEIEQKLKEAIEKLGQNNNE